MGLVPRVRGRVGAFARGLFVACLMFLALVALAGSPREAAAAPHESSTPSAAPAKRTVLAFPPENRGGKQPVFVYLHGIVGGPERGCAEFARAVPTYGWLVCPHANVREGERYSWGGSIAEQWAVVRDATSQVAQEPEVDPSAPIVLLGFSQGAYLAAQLVATYPSAIRAVVFVGANVRPNKATLEQSGVKKVAFAAGQYDETFGYMAESARQLERAGYRAQFRSLGKVGHTYVGDAEGAAMDSLISWIAND